MVRARAHVLLVRCSLLFVADRRALFHVPFVVAVSTTYSTPSSFPDGSLMHGADWLPTLAEAAGIPLTSDKSLANIDGVSQWQAITTTDGVSSAWLALVLVMVPVPVLLLLLLLLLLCRGCCWYWAVLWPRLVQ
jgi:hypothetical protein